jgi:hypothetical protein
MKKLICIRRLTMQRSIKVNKFLAVILSLLILLQICPLGVFSATAIYELKDTTATKIGSFTQSGQTMDIYKLSLDGSKYGSVQLKGRDMLGNRMPVLRTPSGQYKMIQLVRLGIVSETNIGKECYEKKTLSGIIGMECNLCLGLVLP